MTCRSDAQTGHCSAQAPPLGKGCCRMVGQARWSDNLESRTRGHGRPAKKKRGCPGRRRGSRVLYLSSTPGRRRGALRQSEPRQGGGGRGSCTIGPGRRRGLSSGVGGLSGRAGISYRRLTYPASPRSAASWANRLIMLREMPRSASSSVLNALSCAWVSLYRRRRCQAFRIAVTSRATSRPNAPVRACVANCCIFVCFRFVSVRPVSLFVVVGYGAMLRLHNPYSQQCCHAANTWQRCVNFSRFTGASMKN